MYDFGGMKMENEKYYIAVNAGDRYPFLKTPQDYEDICEASVLEYGDILEFAAVLQNTLIGE